MFFANLLHFNHGAAVGGVSTSRGRGNSECADKMMSSRVRIRLNLLVMQPSCSSVTAFLESLTFPNNVLDPKRACMMVGLGSAGLRPGNV